MSEKSLLECETDELLAEIANPRACRDSIAFCYGRVLQRCKNSANDFAGVDWAVVNEAILNRFKRSGLIYIKRLAWRHCS